MSDSCKPFKGQQIKPFRVYSIVLPIVLTILFVEAVYVFSSIPGTLGTALTVTGALPSIKHITAR